MHFSANEPGPTAGGPVRSETVSTAVPPESIQHPLVASPATPDEPSKDPLLMIDLSANAHLDQQKVDQNYPPAIRRNARKPLGRSIQRLR